MTPDARPAGSQQPSPGHRQCSLSGIDADGGHQTTLAAPGTSTRPGRKPAPGASTTEVNAFPVGDALLVRHYFERSAAFGILREYYDSRSYRFEIPRAEFRRVRTRLATHGYDLRPVEDVERFAVAVRKYSEHPEGIVEDSVVQFSAGEYNVFVMKDDAGVRAAVADGAVRLAEAPVTVRIPTGHGTGPLTVRDVS